MQGENTTWNMNREKSARNSRKGNDGWKVAGGMMGSGESENSGEGEIASSELKGWQ